MTNAETHPHDPNYCSPSKQNDGSGGTTKHQCSIDERSYEACAPQHCAGCNFNKGDITKSKVLKFQSLDITDDLRELFFSDPAISGPMMSANYLATKSTARKLRAGEGGPKTSRKSLHHLRCRRRLDGFHSTPTGQHGSDSMVFSSSMHLHPHPSSSDLSDKAASNTLAPYGTATKVSGKNLTKAKLPSPLAKAMEGGVKCHRLPLGSDGLCSNVLDLRYQELASLPCLHMADVGSLHCTGEGIAGRISVLNLSENSLQTLVSDVPQITDVNDRSKCDLVGVKEHKQDLSSVPRSCPIAVFRNISSLDLNNNLISNLDGIEALPSLRSLRAARNVITTLSSLWRAPCLAKLDMLDVSENCIEQLVSPDDVHALRQNPPYALLVLRINYNHLCSLPDCLCMFKQLRVLRARGNKLESVPNAFPSTSFCHKIRCIDLSSNCLSEKDQISLQQCISVLEKNITNSSHDGSRKHAESISLDLRYNEARKTTPLVLESINSPSILTEIDDADHKQCGSTCSVMNSNRKACDRPQQSSSIGTVHADVVTPKRVQSGDTFLLPMSSFKTSRSSGLKRAVNAVNSSSKIEPSTISQQKQRCSSEKEPPQLERSPTSALRLDLERSRSNPVMLATNVWYINVSEMLENLERNLLYIGGRYSTLIPRLARSTALALWDSMPRLGLVYCQGEFRSHPTLIMGNITESCTTNPHCAVLVYQVFRSISILSQEQFSHYLKCTESQTSDKKSAPLSFSPHPAVSGGTSNSKAKGTLPISIKVHHIFQVADTLNTSSTSVGVFSDDAGLWSYVRWRRTWEVKARRCFFRAHNMYTRARSGALGQSDLMVLMERRGGDTQAPLCQPSVEVFLPVPPQWARLYNLLALGTGLDHKSRAKETPVDSEACINPEGFLRPCDTKTAEFADIIPTLQDRGPSSAFVDGIGPRIRVWPAKVSETSRASASGNSMIDQDGGAQGSSKVVSGPLDYVGISLKLLLYVQSSIKRTETMVEQFVGRAQISCPLVSYSRDVIYTARRAALSKGSLLIYDAHRGNINDSIPDVPFAKFLLPK
ncbi:unnamed protein product [Phytomonas sp. EM1]|nr:unnamed protein product [Phytomonas sp. EM1]|eukprot:CCW65275.1 unnamed protein product [Phytomonas sp. isolate EM1]